jgi:hypothetical protein
MIETAIDPRHPRRLEKKANIVAGSSPFPMNAAVLNIRERKFVSRKRIAQGGLIRDDQTETRLETL